MPGMATVVPFPRPGEMFLDARGAARALRVTWHHEASVVVLSLWLDDTCTGTFRLRSEDTPALIDALTRGLAQGYDRGAASGTA